MELRGRAERKEFMNVIIRGRMLPGRTCVTSGGTYENVHVGVQKKAEVVELRPADAQSVEWVLPIDVVTTKDGTDFKGPFAQGKKGDRFLYLSWGAVDDKGTFTMFRRAKLVLATIDSAVIEAAVAMGQLVGELVLTLPNGTPVCASIKPPRISWS